MLDTAVELNAFIAQSLSPALAISGAGLLTVGLQNRIGMLGSRVRELNREHARHHHKHPIARNIKQQLKQFVFRIQLVRNSLFSLYAAIGLMVLTAFELAIITLPVFSLPYWCPIFTFLGGLLWILIATIMEGIELAMVLKTVQLDIDQVLHNTVQADDLTTLEI